MDTQIIPHAVLTLPRDERDYVRGVSSEMAPAENNPSCDWSVFLPTDEPQRFHFDTNECTQLSGINDVAGQCNFLKQSGKLSPQALTWFEENGYFDDQGLFAFSERFTGILSGTSINGNSPWAFWKTISKYGLLSRKDLGYTLEESAQFASQAAMCADYYRVSAIEPWMREKALQALKWLTVEYEWIGGESEPVTPVAQIKEALAQAPVQIGVPVCVPAWNQTNVPFCGVREADHCIMIYDVNPDGSWNIRDQYSPYNKTLSADYYIPQAILGVVRAAPLEAVAPVKSTWASALELVESVFGFFVRPAGALAFCIDDIIIDSSHNYRF